MVDNNTLSVQEYADIKHVTPQAVYKKLRSDNPPEFIILKGGKKDIYRIDIGELTESEREELVSLRSKKKDKVVKVYKTQSSRQTTNQPTESLQQPINQPVNNHTPNTPSVDVSSVPEQGTKETQTETSKLQSERIAELKEEVEYLRKELSKATDEISRLTYTNQLQAQQLATLQLSAHTDATDATEVAEQASPSVTIENTDQDKQPTGSTETGFWAKVKRLLTREI